MFVFRTVFVYSPQMRRNFRRKFHFAIDEKLRAGLVNFNSSSRVIRVHSMEKCSQFARSARMVVTCRPQYLLNSAIDLVR